ncbi:MAG: PAS domain S-box protein, partial [Gemmatimonadota bacterium]|nr:PAS domain S-box protein [Gemmatimonadota bacterium]
MPKKKTTDRDLKQRVLELEIELKKAKSDLNALEERNAAVDRENIRNARIIHTYRSKINMPELYLDEDCRIIGHSENFITLTSKVIEFAREKRSLRDFILKKNYKEIKKYIKELKCLQDLPYDKGKPWKLRLEGPGAGDRIGKNWITSPGRDNCCWSIESSRSGGRKIIHRPHIEDRLDCFLMSSEEYGGPDEDVKIVYRVKTAKEARNIMDLSLVISGASGRDHDSPDMVGYTACTGSENNSKAILQQQRADIVTIPETLHADTEYEITVERTGGRIRRTLKNLDTGDQTEPVDMIHTDALYETQNHFGFTTFSGEMEISSFKVYTRKSLFSIEQFRVPFDAEVRLRDKLLQERIFKLRTGCDETLERTVFSLLFEDITERKLAEEALRDSEKRHRMLLDIIPYGIQELDLSGCITYTNPAYQKMTGYSARELHGRPLSDMIATESEGKKLREYLERLIIKQPVPVPWTGKNRTKSGIIIDIQVNWNYKRDKTGRLTGFISVVSDISERRQAEDELLFLGSITQQVSDAIIVTDKDYKITYINQAAENLYGYPLEELIGQTPAIVNAEPQAKDIQENIYMTLSEGKTWSGIHSNRKWDGSIFLCEMKISPLRDMYGRIYSYIGVTHDITERNMAEQALSESEEKYRTLFENSPEALLVYDADTLNIVETNQAALNLYGYSEEEFIQLACLDLSFNPDNSIINISRFLSMGEA